MGITTRSCTALHSSGTPPGAELFAQLREASGNYAVPADACPTYEKTYRLLEELENEFSA